MKQENTYDAHFYRSRKADSRFFAYFLHRKMEQENKDLGALADDWHCDLSGMYRLAACLVPTPKAPDTEKKLTEVANYTGLPVERLRQMLKEVRFLDRLRSTMDEEGEASSLMAAREKGESE